MSISAPIDQFLPSAIPPEPVCRLSVSQYHEMIATGILAPDEPVELLEGWLVPKMVRNPPHSTARQLTATALRQILPAGWHVRSQEPITLGDSEPEPDVAVVRGDLGRYERSHPGPQDVALIVEVADASVQRDRSIKKRVYARAGIPVYWIINLPERRIEVYTDPAARLEAADYRRREDYTARMEVPLTIECHDIGQIPVTVLLPATVSHT
jgi:Uma2 family endonuclease